MKVISYAQNFEDVILARAFRGHDRGFFIDAGAAHPISHSVTKLFYDRGWRGINIEPGTWAFSVIEVERGRDINLNVGVSNKQGTLTFHEAPDSHGISTFNANWRSDWQSRDGCHFIERTVEVTTLARICEQWADQPIDFLKIDVEGHELEVVEGGDFARWRPRIVVVEGEREIYQDALLSANYHHATFDGVNHYFVSEEELHLIPLLAAPVSLVHDNFELHEFFLEREAHERTRRALEKAESRGDELEEALQDARRELDELRLLRSSSTRLEIA